MASATRAVAVVHYDDGDRLAVCRITGPSSRLSRSADHVTCVECLQDVLNGERYRAQKEAESLKARTRWLARGIRAIDDKLIRGRSASAAALRKQILAAKKLAADD